MSPDGRGSVLRATTATTWRSIGDILAQRAAKISWLTEAKARSKAIANSARVTPTISRRVERVVADLLHVVRSAAGQVHDLGDHISVETDARLTEGLGQGSSCVRVVEWADRERLEEPDQRLMSRSNIREQTWTRRDDECHGQVGGVELEGTCSQVQERVPGVGKQVNVVEEPDDSPLPACSTLDEVSDHRAKLAPRITGRPPDTSIGDTDVEPDLHLDTPTPIRRQLSIDRRDQAGEELVRGLRVGHRQDDGVAGLLPKSTPVHQQRRLADRPLAEQRGVRG